MSEPCFPSARPLERLLTSGTVRKLVIIILIGLTIRYFIGIMFTYPTDINYWILVSENLISGENLFGLPGYYYTPVWGYFMSVISAMAGFIGIPMGEYVPELVGGSMAMDWKIVLPSISYTLLVKSFLFAFDLLVAFALYRIGKILFDEQRAIMMFAIWFLCPFTIIISSIRVMFENLEILFMLLSLLMVLERRFSWAGVMMGLSLMTKPYEIFLAILLIGYLFAQTKSMKAVVSYVATALITGVLVMVPIIVSGQIDESLIWLTSRVDGGGGYNVTLYLMPALVIVSLAASFIIAFFRLDSFRLLIGVTMIITSAMLVVPGNIQYYLLLFPFLLLFRSRCTYPAQFMFLLLSVFAFISYSTWSSTLYVHAGYWGSGLLDAFTDYLWPIDSTLDYNKFKAVTAMLVLITPVVAYCRGEISD